MAFLQKYIIPYLISALYWLWTRTWRLQYVTHPDLEIALKKGPVAFAHWHADNLVLVTQGRRLHIASLASTSKDGELITKVLKLFGFGIARGSSTRSGVRALVGMLARVREGYNPAIACDGPKGPPLKAKPGIIYVAEKAGIPLAPVGVAKSSALVFNKAWDKTHMPWPFSKVVVSFGAPLKILEVKEVERRLHAQRDFSEKYLRGNIKI